MTKEIVQVGKNRTDHHSEDRSQSPTVVNGILITLAMSRKDIPCPFNSSALGLSDSFSWARVPGAFFGRPPLSPATSQPNFTMCEWTSRLVASGSIRVTKGTSSVHFRRTSSSQSRARKSQYAESGTNSGCRTNR